MTLRARVALADPTLWITVRRSTYSGRRCRDYSFHDPDGEVLLEGRAFVWEREVRVTVPGSGELVLRLRRRLSFPLTGRVDVLAAGGVVGSVYRSGRLTDARGRQVGRFRDARSAGARAGESLLVGIGDALVGADGSQVSSPTAYICVQGGKPVGTLALAPLPWPQPAAAEPPALLAAARRFLPARARRMLGRLAAPSGWRFQREAPLLALDPLLTIGAALFQVELSQW